MTFLSNDLGLIERVEQAIISTLEDRRPEELVELATNYPTNIENAGRDLRFLLTKTLLVQVENFLHRNYPNWPAALDALDIFGDDK